MDVSSQRYDFVIVGGGITGLSIARSLLTRLGPVRIAIVEKEKQLGGHASGRNSGVLHSGIYYPVDSLKAKFCSDGARRLAAYCEERGCSLNRLGKVIVPLSDEHDKTLDMLQKRAAINGARTELVDETQLAELEPATRSVTGRALYSPDTAVFDPCQILESLREDLVRDGVAFRFGDPVTAVDVIGQRCLVGPEWLSYGHLFNAAGAFADRLATSFEVGTQYQMIPFKGFYYEIVPGSPIRMNGLIYPVPDLGMPFLGVHTIKSAAGEDLLGPSAAPALGPEHYQGLRGVDLATTANSASAILMQYYRNKQGFRGYAHREMSQWFRAGFLRSAQALLPELKPDFMRLRAKVGIRAQLYDRQDQMLVMDFLVLEGRASTHVLNVVSPGFTSGFSFADYVVKTALTIADD